MLCNGRQLEIVELRTRDGGIVAVASDITDTLARERALQESEARLREAARLATKKKCRLCK